MVKEGGNVVPYSYGQLETEYIALRQRAAVMDISHHALYRVEGRDALPFLNRILTASTENLKEWQSTRGFALNERGGIIDGFNVYRDRGYCLLMGSAGGHEETMAWLKKEAAADNTLDVKVHDVNSDQGRLQVLGPASHTVMQRFAFGLDTELERGMGEAITVGAAKVLVIRRPPLHIDGYDVIAGNVHLRDVWEKLVQSALAAGGSLGGLGAREIARVEAGQGKLGAEIDSDTTPVEIEEESLVDFTKRRFPGRRALMHSTSSEFSRLLVTLEIRSRKKLNRGAEILSDQLPIGRITTPSHSPMIQRPISLAFVNSLKAFPGSKLRVATPDGEINEAVVIKPPSNELLLR